MFFFREADPPPPFPLPMPIELQIQHLFVQVIRFWYKQQNKTGFNKEFNKKKTKKLKEMKRQNINKR